MKEQVFNDCQTFEGKALNDIFQDKVLSNTRIVWYIDYYLENPEDSDVELLAKCSKTGKVIQATNENKEVRDPSDPEGTQWDEESVAGWFIENSETSKIEHKWIILFKSGDGEIFGIHFEANRVFCFGPEALDLPTSNLWEDYVEDGLLGPIVKSNLGATKINLLCLIDQPDMFGMLNANGVLDHYMMALTGILSD